MNIETLIAIATELGCTVPAIRAVAEVESAGSGFQADGRPKILFEAHIFSARTKRRFDASHPDLSSPSWNRALYKGGAAEWGRLNRAIALDARAALESASWGAFQIMGFNHLACGFGTVEDMVTAMKTEAGQLWAFARFIRGNPAMHRALKAHDWTSFTRLYNGPGQVPVYSARIADAYARYAPVAPNMAPNVAPDTAPNTAAPETAAPSGFMLPPVDPNLPAKGIGSSKSVLVGTGGAIAGVAAIADQAGQISYAVGSASAAVGQASGVWGTIKALGPAVPWALTGICVAALVFVVWRYVLKARRGDVVIR